MAWLPELEFVISLAKLKKNSFPGVAGGGVDPVSRQTTSRFSLGTALGLNKNFCCISFATM